MYSMTRTQLRNLNIEQAQYLNKPTTEAYLEFAKANKIAPVTDDIGNGAKGHWLGDKSAKVVLLYLHGTSSPYPENIASSRNIHVLTTIFPPQAAATPSQ